MSGAATTTVELDARDVTVRYGGLLAVDRVNLRASSGALTGLIGPNGAGKTTFFNACTGLVRPTTGTVSLGGERLDHHSQSWRASHGLGRTFQRMALFDTMTALENVSMGLECRLSGRTWLSQLWAPPKERSRCRAAATEAMEQCGIAHLGGVKAGDLSTGQRRLVELSRAITSGFRFLLLDEPSSGLDEAETEAFAQILTDIVERGGTGILLVEHDMTLVRAVCSYIYVLDFGKLVFEGTTGEVMASEIVQAAYLGTEEVA